MTLQKATFIIYLAFFNIVLSNIVLAQSKSSAVYQIKNASINSELADFAPMYYRNGIIFASELNGTGKDNWEQRKAPHLDLFFSAILTDDPAILGSPEKLSVINTGLHEGTSTTNADFSQMFFTANYSNSTDGINKLRILGSASNGGTWSKPSDFPYNNPNYSLGHPSLTPDGKTLFFVSDMPGTIGGTDIYVSHLSNSGWSRPENLGPAINTESNEMFPFIATDGTLYFASNGHSSMGGLDIFTSTQQGSSWTKAQALPTPINSVADDFSLIINADNTQGYFSSNRSGGKGVDDIYSFTTAAVKPAIISCIVKGKIFEKDSGAPVVNALVKLIETRTGSTEVATTDNNGMYSFAVNSSEDYTIYVTKRNYFTEVRSFTTKGKDCKSPLEQNIPLDISISRIPDEPISIISGGGSSRPDLPLPTINNIYYDFDKDDIRLDAQVELDKIVKFMKDNPDVKIELLSHTDARGKEDYNLALSERRAQSAMNYIISKGIPPSQITAKGMGESKIINKCKNNVNCTDAEHEQNRRTEFVITGFK
jgi:outer membrane protein OmpA-like peptidoglycan-associated protein